MNEAPRGPRTSLVLGIVAPVLATLLAVAVRWRAPVLPLAVAGYGLAAVLWIVGLVFGILALAATRPTGRRPSIVPAIGPTICVLLLVWAAYGLMQQRGLYHTGPGRRVLPGSDYDATRTIVDEDYRFELAWPGERWKLLREQDARHITADAVAGAVRDGGYGAVIIIESAPGMRLEPLVRLVVDNMTVEGKHIDKTEDIRYCDQAAVRTTLSGKVNGLDLRYVVMLFIRDGFAYQLLAWAPRDLAPDASTLAPFFSAFKLRPGPVRGRQHRRQVLEANGPGWRLSKGRFASAAYGFELEQRGGWQIVVGPDLENMNATAEVGIAHSNPDSYMVVIAERAAGTRAPEHAARLGDEMQAALTAGADAPSARTPAEAALTCEVAGKSVSFRQFRNSAGMEFLHGVLVQDDLYLQLLVWHMEALRPTVRPRILEALGGLRLLEPERLGKLQSELRGSFREQVQVGSGYSLRNGVYRSFEAAFSWQSPGGAFRAYAGERAHKYNSNASLVVVDPATGLWGLLIPELTSFSAEEFHRAARAPSLGDGAGAPRPLTIGGLPALQSVGTARVNGTRYHYWVTTAVAPRQSYQVLFWTVPGAAGSAQRSVDAALAGFRFHQSPPRRTEVVDGSYRDLRLGFQFRPPEGWRLKEGTGPRFAPIASQASWSSGRSQVLVMAIYNPVLAGDGGRWITSFVEQYLRETFGGQVYGTPKESEITLAGRRARRLAWSGLRGTCEASLLTRGSILYMLVLSDDLGWSAEKLAPLRAGFTLLD